MRKHGMPALLCGLILLLTTACGGESLEESGDSGSGEAGSVTVAGQDFTEMQIMAEMYKAVLEAKGYSVDLKLVGTRDIYLPELKSGAVDIAPEYAGSITDALQLEVNGADAPLVSSPDLAETMQAFEKLAEPIGLTALQPAKATDQNAYAVTEDYAAEHDLTTLSDLGRLGEPIKLARPPTVKTARTAGSG